jgi:hypothetical protein
MSDRDIREILAQEFLATARWRREKSVQSPAERGHAASAQALERLAEDVRSRPPDDERLGHLRHLNRDLEFFNLGEEETRELIDRVGFDAALAPADLDRFLDRLVAAAREDADQEQRQRFPSPDLPGVTPRSLPFQGEGR